MLYVLSGLTFRNSTSAHTVHCYVLHISQYEQGYFYIQHQLVVSQGVFTEWYKVNLSLHFRS